MLKILNEIGFFDILGISGRGESAIPNLNHERLSLPIISGATSDEALLMQIDGALGDLVGFLHGDAGTGDRDVFLMTSIGEAITNVTNCDAHPKDATYDVSPLERWWVTGTADRTANRLTIVMYDQGVTIPATIAENARKSA